MSIAFVAAETTATSTGATSLAVSAPSARREGDGLVLAVTHVIAAGTASVDTPTGWTLLSNGNASGAHARRLFVRQATGDGDDEPTITTPATGSIAATMVAYRGLDVADMSASVETITEDSDVFAITPVEPSELSAVIVAFSMQAAFSNDGVEAGEGILRGSVRGEGSSDGLNCIVDQLFKSGSVEASISSTAAGIAVAMIAVVATPTRDRVSSSISEDAGSILEATTLIPVESGISESFLSDVDLTPGIREAHSELLTPNELSAVYFPLPTRNQEYLSTYSGETQLGRMARTYPRALIGRVADIAYFDGASTATPQQILEYLFSEWADEFDWFTYADVPDLRLLVSAAIGNERDYYVDNPAGGLLSIEAVAIPQETGSRRTMREILNEWLSIFPGTILRQNTAGDIELVPRVGPDAPVDAVRTLTWNDLYGISEGEDDPRGVVNRCRVESRGYGFEDDQAVIAPSYLIAAVSFSEDILTTEGVHPSATRERAVVGGKIEFTELVEPTAVDVAYDLTIYGSHSAAGSSGFSVEGQTSGTLSLSPGGTETVSLTYTSRGSTNTVHFDISRTRDGDGVYVKAVRNMADYHYSPFGQTYLSHVLLLDVTGSAWTQSDETIVGEFGYSGETLPSASGGDALVDSVQLYGEREATISTSTVQLTAEQAQEIAQSYVLANISPRTIRQVEQSLWNKFPVRFDDIGRLVALPNGEIALVQNRSYTDQFAPRGGFVSSSFTAAVTDDQLASADGYLFLDDGNYFQADDETVVESS